MRSSSERMFNYCRRLFFVDLYMRGQKNGRAEELKRTALYEVWRDMLKRAKREGDFLRKLKLSKELMPVDSMFREFGTFALWARLSAGYTIGVDDDKFIARHDNNKPWCPDNCFFTNDPKQKQDFDEDFYITKGANQAEYKNSTSKRKRLGGLSGTRLYDIWKGMCRRCSDPAQKDYKDYGARGITVCDDWRLDFIKFYDWSWEHGYDPELSIDRIDVDRGYCPDNCRWASDLEQKLNKRVYAGKYTNLRLKASKMRAIVDKLPDSAVVTLIVRSSFLDGMNTNVQDEYPPVPVGERLDKVRAKGV